MKILAAVAACAIGVGACGCSTATNSIAGLPRHRTPYERMYKFWLANV